MVKPKGFDVGMVRFLGRDKRCKMQVNVQAARQARQLKESKAGAAFSLGRSLPPSSAQPPLASAWPASSWPHRLADQYQEQDDDHGASPVFGGPSSAGRVRPSGSSLNGYEQKFAAAVLLACSLACLLALRVLARFACSCFCSHNGAGLVRKGTAAPRNLD